MARIPAEELARLKREISVQRLVEGAGVKLHRHGKDLLGLCPFHDDREPSLVVSPAKNLWHCLGACSSGGSVIDWVMRTEGVSFRHAVEILREGGPVVEPSPESGRAEPASPSSESPPPSQGDGLEGLLDVSMSDAELLEAVVAYYHQTLLEQLALETSDARTVLEKRGLIGPECDEDLVRRFRLGLANRTLGYRLPPKSRKDGQELRGRLQTLGILRESGHEHFNGSLIVPVLDEAGRVSTIYGRKTGERLRKGTPLHLYLSQRHRPGGDRGAWNLAGLVGASEVILCESLIDALTFWAHGFRAVTTSYGVNGFPDALLEPLRKVGRVLIAYDRDEAGDAAAEKLAKRLEGEGIACWRVRFPKGMDANEYAMRVRPARQSLDLVLRRAEWMGEGAEPVRGVPVVGGEAAKEEEAGSRPPRDSAHRNLNPVADQTIGLGIRCSNDQERSDAPTPRSEVWCSAEEDSVELSSLAAAPCSESEEPTEASADPESVLPQAPTLEIPTEVSETEVTITLGDRRYRVRGMDRNLSYDTLKINLAAFRGEGFHVDSLDLYAARQRAAFLKAAAAELGLDVDVLKRDLGKVLLKLEELQDQAIREALAPKEIEVTMSDAERRRALDLLRDPNLLERIGEDLGMCGLVGEESNKLTAYLACISRKLERPLAVVIQSSSAAGKSALMDAVLSFVPEEERVSYSAMTGQSLYYLGEKDLAHKVLAVAEEEGAERASYALKLLQSEGELSIASTGKDPATGRLQTQEYHVEGPVALLLTTTAIDVDEELLNRCLILSVDEGRSQTEAIHALQRDRETLEGQLRAREGKRLRSLHRNAQRLLEPLLVVNPYAASLRFPSGSTRTRRDHGKYLGLIRVIALLHQHQRDRKSTREGVEYIEVAPSDIAWANRLAEVVLGRTLDELPPQTRRLLEMLDAWVGAVADEQQIERAQVRFTRREIRESFGWGDTQLKVHLARLVDYEYLAAYRGGDVGGMGGMGGMMYPQRFVYELLVERGSSANRFRPGLVNASDLEAVAGTTQNRSGSNHEWSALEGERSGAGRPLVGGWSGTGRGAQSAAAAGPVRQNGHIAPETEHLAHPQQPVVVPASRRSERLSG